jgi:SAM-dependent methyltransferase
MLNIFTAVYHAYLAQAAIVAVKLGVFEHLKDGPKSLNQICTDTDTHPTPLRHILKVLCTYEFLEEREERYHLTKSSAQLMRAKNAFIPDYLLYAGEQILPAFAHLEEAARTGESAFILAHGKSLWELCRTDRAQGKVFEDHMNSATRWHAAIVAKALDCSEVKTLVDIGGGHASLVSAILKRNPHLSAVMLDQPHLADRATERLRAEGLLDRCEFVGGDFFRSVPPDADLYTIKHVLHDWKDEDVARILSNIRAAMRPDSRLVIIEGVMDTGGEDPDWMGARNLEQFVTTGGYQRTRREFSALLEASGLSLDRVQSTPIGDCSLIHTAPR